MLDTLIESKNKRGENRRLGGFLLSTVSGAAMILICALVYSLFNYNLALGSGNLDVSSIVAPVAMTEDAPPPEQPAAAPKQARASIKKSISKLPTRRENMMRVDEVPTVAPDTTSVVKNAAAARPNGNFALGKNDSNPPASGAFTAERGTGTGIGKSIGDAGFGKSQVEETAKSEIAPPPILKPAAPKVEIPKKTTMISGGVVNGRAVNLVKPEYSKAAQAVRAGGEVKVQVTIDEDGSVIAASAVSGHPLLKPAAARAARSSKFSPTLLSNQKVKVTGIIVYNFKQQ